MVSKDLRHGKTIFLFQSSKRYVQAGFVGVKNTRIYEIKITWCAMQGCTFFIDCQSLRELSHCDGSEPWETLARAYESGADL
jgi:hypothetical protein